MAANIMSATNLISTYFHDGFSYFEIIELLKQRHGVEISLSTLKRRLKALGLRKRATAGVRSSIDDVRDAVQDKLVGSGSRIGYRRIHKSLTTGGLIVRFEDVRKTLKELDPRGVELRKRDAYIVAITLTQAQILYGI